MNSGEKMRIGTTFIFITLLVLGTMGTAYAGSFPAPPSKADPPGSFRIFYEWDNFFPGESDTTPGKSDVHKPGADLQGPGDAYRYTVMRDDQYGDNPNYEVVRAMIGIHIDDYDWNRESGDGKPEWGKILINGQPAKALKFSPVDPREPALTDFVEIVGDEEISPKGAFIPPYIFMVTDEFKNSKSLTVEIVNLRKDGSVDGTAPYGDFVVNRIGAHVWYKKK
jgi:hypothetical protein